MRGGGQNSEGMGKRLLDRGADLGGDLGDESGSGRERPLHAGTDETDHFDDAHRCAIPWKRLSAVFFIALAVATWVTEIQVTNYVLGGDNAYDNVYALV